MGQEVVTVVCRSCGGGAVRRAWGGRSGGLVGSVERASAVCVVRVPGFFLT